MQVKHGATLLRRLRPEDLAPFLAYRSDLVVAEFQSWEAMPEREALGFLTAMSRMEPLVQPGHWTQIAVADAANDALLGDMGWHLDHSGTEIELGITLSRSAQGKGHATRAMMAALDHLTETTAVTRFVAYADLRNMASRALLNRAGFSSTGTETAEDGIEEEIFEWVAQRAGV